MLGVSILVLSTICSIGLCGICYISFYFNNISVISFTQFYWWEELEFPKKTNNLQVKDKLYTSTVRCIEHTLAQVEIKSPKL
jgi:hypothetical protein